MIEEEIYKAEEENYYIIDILIEQMFQDTELKKEIKKYVKKNKLDCYKRLRMVDNDKLIMFNSLLRELRADLCYLSLRLRDEDEAFKSIRI